MPILNQLSPLFLFPYEYVLFACLSLDLTVLLIPQSGYVAHSGRELGISFALLPVCLGYRCVLPQLLTLVVRISQWELGGVGLAMPQIDLTIPVS